MKIKEIMTTDLVTVTMDDSLGKVHELFEQSTFHHVLVLEEQELVGLISDRDVLKAMSPFVDGHSERSQDRATMQVKVHQFMSRNPLTVKPDLSISQAITIMDENGISCLPVQDDDGKILGIVTSNDIIKWAAQKDDGE